jgi:hypothetical protein
VRRIILSTNIAETSVTTDGCAFAVACDKMKDLIPTRIWKVVREYGCLEQMHCNGQGVPACIHAYL